MADKQREEERLRRTSPRFALAGLVGTLFPFGRARRIHRRANALRRGAARIPGAVQCLEQQYVAMQEQLAYLGPAAGELAERGKKLVELASGRETARTNVARSQALIGASLEGIAGTQRTLSELIVELRDTARGIRALLGIEKDLADAIGPLDYVQVMLRIESARLPAGQQEVFSGLTAEIAALCMRARALFESNMDSISSVESFLSGATADVERRQVARQKWLEVRRAEINAALEKLSADIGRNEGRNVQLSSATKGLAAEVSRAVMALQTQDIVAQRLDHACRGLAEAEAAARDFARTGRRAASVQAKAILRIEREQIRSVGGDMLRAEEDLNRAVKGIHSSLEMLDADTLAMKEFDELSFSVKGTVQILLDGFAEARELIADASGSIREIEEIIRPCRSLADNVTSTVGEISHLMRLIALNAQIHAIKIGDGTGLEVLAAHTSGISAATTATGAKAAESVSAIVDRLGGIVQTVERLQAEFGAEERRLEDECSAEESLLHAFRDVAIAEIRGLGTSLRQAREATARMLMNADCSTVLDVLKDVLADADELERLAGSQTGTSAEELNSVSSGIRSGYSMSRERRVHDEAIGLVAGADRIPDMRQAEGIELF